MTDTTADSPPATAKTVVCNAFDGLFGRRDINAIDRYWSPRYVEHSIVGGEGLVGLRETVAALPDGFRHERLRLFADGDLVVAHGIYHGLGPAPIVAFDLWQVADGKITEHWGGVRAVSGPRVAPRAGDVNGCSSWLLVAAWVGGPGGQAGSRWPRRPPCSSSWRAR